MLVVSPSGDADVDVNLTLTKTSGNPGFAQPDPNDVIPARYQRPS